MHRRNGRAKVRKQEGERTDTGARFDDRDIVVRRNRAGACIDLLCEARA